MKRIATAAQALWTWCNGRILGCWGNAWEGKPAEEYFIPAFPTLTFQDFI